MGYTWKIRQTEKKRDPTWKNRSLLEKWVPLRKMGQTWKNESSLQNWVKKQDRSLLKSHNYRNKIPFGKTGKTGEKSVKLWKMAHFLETWSHVEKWVTVTKMRHTSKNGPQRYPTLKNGSQGEKLVTLTKSWETDISLCFGGLFSCWDNLHLQIRSCKFYCARKKWHRFALSVKVRAVYGPEKLSFV